MIDGSHPAKDAADVTPNDAVDLPHMARALYVGVAGNVRVTLLGMADDAYVTFTAHPVGYMPTVVKRVWSTGTTATNMLALYD